jgi:hypothetical protein
MHGTQKKPTTLRLWVLKKLFTINDYHYKGQQFHEKHHEGQLTFE